MDANLFSQIASGIGMAGGLWALVRWAEERKQNGNGGGSPGEPPVINPALREMRDEQASSNALIIKALNEIKDRKPEPIVVPEPDLSWLKDLTERMDAVLQMGPPVLKPNITVKNDPPDFSSVEKRMDKLIQQVSRLMTPFNPKEGGGGEAVAPRAPGPIVLNPNPVHLEIFNTVHAQEWEILELVPPETDLYYISLLNLGPGHLYMRQDEPPIGLDDPHATTIPAGGGDNTISTPKQVWVLADEGGSTMSIRLSYVPAT